MKIRLIAAFTFCFAVSSCAVPSGPKTKFIDGIVAPEEAAVVDVSVVPDGLMLLQSVNGKTTHDMSRGFTGAIYLAPGEYTFGVKVSKGIGADSPSLNDPNLVPPEEANVAPVKGVGGSILVRDAGSLPEATVEKGKEYKIRYGYKQAKDGTIFPVTWVSEVPSA